MNGTMNKQIQSVAILLTILGAIVPISGASDGNELVVEAAQLQGTKLTPSLVDWISEQCEQMSQEMDAIIKTEVVDSAAKFSVVNYLRYLSLYDQLSVVAKRDDVDKFRWIGKKVRAYTNAYKGAINILLDYVRGLDVSLMELENKEKKSKQVGVSSEWAQLYDTVNYIATHSPKDSKLAMDANEVLQKSPNGTEDKKRSTRYSLYVRVN